MAHSRTILLSLGYLSLLSAPDALGQVPFTFQEELRLEPPGATFANVSDVDMLSTGDLWIVDGQTGELWIADEGHLRRVATAGPGPGELRPGAIELVVLPGDTVLLIERVTARASAPWTCRTASNLPGSSAGDFSA